MRPSQSHKLDARQIARRVDTYSRFLNMLMHIQHREADLAPPLSVWTGFDGGGLQIHSSKGLYLMSIEFSGGIAWFIDQPSRSVELDLGISDDWGDQGISIEEISDDARLLADAFYKLSFMLVAANEKATARSRAVSRLDEIFENHGTRND